MPSLHKDPRGRSPYWYCSFTTGDGKRHFRSTKTDDKKVAAEICRTWAHATLHSDGLTPDRAREIIARGVSDALIAATGESLPSETFRVWTQRWLDAKSLENEPTTHSRYELAIRSFLEYLGAKADKDMSRITSNDVMKWRDQCASKLAPASVNTNLRAIRACFGSACQQDLLTKNPASKVASIKERGEAKRRALTLEEIRRILAHCGNTEWRGLVLLGLYSGQRLGDCARITWGQIDLVSEQVSFVTQKTGKRLAFALAKPLVDYFTSIETSDKPSDFVFPQLAQVAIKSISSVSNAFALQILIPAGLMTKRLAKHESSGKGRSGKRAVNEVTYHSLRHTFTTLIKATGASSALAELIVGHSSTAISNHYTHLSASDTTAMIAKLPDVTK